MQAEEGAKTVRGAFEVKEQNYAAKIASLQQLLADTNVALQRESETSEEHAKQIEQQQEQLAQHQESLAVAERKLSDAQRQLSECVAERDNRMKELVEELIALKAELERVNSDLSVGVDRENAVRQENSNLKSTFESLQTEFNSFR